MFGNARASAVALRALASAGVLGAALLAACDSSSGLGSGPHPESDPSHPGALSRSVPSLVPASQLTSADLRGPWASHTDPRLAQVGASTPVSAPAVAGSGVPQYYVLWQNKVTGDRVMWRMAGTYRNGGDIALPHEDPVWDMAAIADFTGDGDPEILFQNKSTGNRGMWSLKGTTWNRWIQLYSEKPEWDFAAAADFTGDGQPDIVFQNTSTGDRGFWWMDHEAYRGSIPAPHEQPSWRMAGAADFTGDGQNDILFENTQTGQRGIWQMNGSTYVDWRSFTTEDTVWQMAAAHDVTGDGKPDILFQNKKTGLRGWWIMNGTQYQTWVALGTVSPEWDIVGEYTYANAVTSPAADPRAPANLVASTNTTGTVLLTWQDNTTDEQDFILQRSVVDTLHFVLVADLPPNNTFYYDPRTNTTQNTYYRVKSCGTSSCTAWSNVATAVYAATATTGSATKTSDTQVRLDGTFTTGNSTPSGRFDVSRTPGFESFVSYTAFALLFSDQSFRAATIPVAPGDTMPYYYRAVATDPRGPAYGAVRYFRQRPPVISSVSASYDPASFKVNLAWSVLQEQDPNQRATSQVVNRYDVATGATTRLFLDVGVAATQTADSTFPLHAARTYRYDVVACNTFGCATASSPQVTTTALAPPQNVQAVLLTPNSVQVTWSPSAGADRYAVYVRTSPGFTGIRGYAAGTSYTDTKVTPGTTYWYQVQALRGSRGSFLSPEVMVADPDTTAAAPMVTTGSVR